jgi:ribose/xylose/arabinose/galactoside ABC-type transport system permease subunit
MATGALTRANRSFALRTALILGGLAAVVAVVNALTHGNVLTTGNVLNVLRQITYNAILAVGQTFVIITAGIDLSVGSLVQLSGVVLALFANGAHVNGAALIAATVGVAIALGGVVGFVNALPVVRLGLPPFITTLAMMLIARGLAYKISHGRPIPLEGDAMTAFTGLGTGFAFERIPIVVLWMAVIVVVFGIVLTRTRFGRYIFALGGNEEAARLAGIDTGTVKTAAYMISGMCAAIAGMLLMARFSSGSPQTGVGFELQSIAAVVVGGTSLMGGRGSIWGTFVGALLIGVLNNVMNLLDIESYTQEIVLGAVILFAVVLDELRKRYLRR